MAISPAFVFTCVVFYFTGCSAIAGRDAKARTPTYEGPYQGLTKNNQWDYHDHGVSWAMGYCHSGVHQSPIALPTEVKNNSMSLYYRYKEISKQVTLFNDGYMFSVTPDVCTGGFGIGESTVIDGQPLELESKYSLALVVFHSPSEHTWSGEHLPLEVQLIHRKSDDPESQAIIAIGFNHAMDEVEEHPFLAALLEQNLPIGERASSSVNTLPAHSLDFAALIDEGKMWTYDGSMTVPSCKPNAKWFVRQHYIEAPIDQINKFSDAVMQMTSQSGNNRVVQPLGEREVTLIKTKDATNMKTIEEKQKEVGQSAPPTVAVEGDADDEDAVQVSSSVHVDPDLDEGHRKDKEKVDTFMIHTSEQILATFSREIIMHYPDQIKDHDQAIIEARKTLQTKTEGMDAASQVMGSACDFAEEDATSAKIKTCDSSKEVVTENEAEVKAAQKILDERSVEVDTQIRDAQEETQKQIDNETEQTQANPDEKTVESVPHDVQPLNIPVPQGDVNDPFSTDCAETSSRINSEHPVGSAEQLTPNLDQSALVPGIHTTESDEEEPDVMAPTDGEDDDDAPALFLQAHRGSKNHR